MLFAFVVYGMAGKVIWSKRRHLDGFLNPLNENPFINMVTTEIEITHEERFIVKDGSGQEMADMANECDPYSVAVRVDSKSHPSSSRPLPAALRMRTLTRDAAEAETNAEAWLYARVAFLFFFALIITWVPTSVNRVYTLVNPTVVNFPLNYISSLVFPLQGFWNLIVYVITSQTACRRLWNRLTWRSSGRGGNDLTDGKDNRRIYPTTGSQRLRSISSLSGNGP
jgi:hypothetical protein